MSSPHFYLQRLQLQQLRKFETLELADLAPGLNIFAGPNGAGKSSIVRALRATFLERHSSSSAADLQPQHDSSASPQVALDFVLHGQPYQLVKSFLKKKRCDLTSGSQHWSAQAAEDYLAEQLGFQFAPKSTKPELWGVPGLLWVEQGAQPDALSASVQHASRHLHAALHSQSANGAGAPAAALAATAGDGLIARLEQELAQYLGKNGKPIGPLAQLIHSMEDNRAALAQCQQRIADYRSQVDALAQDQQAQADDVRERPEQAWEQSLAQAQAQLQQHQQLQQQHQQDQAQAAHIASRIELLTRALQAQAAQSQQLAQRAQAWQQAQVQAAQAEQHWQQAHTQAAQAEQAQVAAQQRWQQAEAQQRRQAQRQALAAQQAQAQQQVQQLQGQWDEAQQHLQNLQLLTQALSALAPEKADILQLQKLEQTVHTVSVQQAALATQLRFDLPAGQQLAWHSADAQGQWQGQGQAALATPTEVQLPGGGRLWLAPGGPQAAQAAQQLAQAQQQLQAALARLGVADVAAAQAAWEQRQQALQQHTLATQALQLYAPLGVDALAASLAQAQTQAERCQQQWQALAAQGAEDEGSAADAHALQAQAQAAQQAGQAAQQALAHAAQQRALTQQQCHNAEREHTALARQLDDPQARASLQTQQQALVQLQAQAASLQTQLAAQAQTLADPALQFAAQDVARLQASIAAHAQQVQARQQRITALQASLAAVGGSGLEEQAAELQGQLAQQERQASAQQRHAQVLQYLLQQLKDARAAAVQRLQAPLAQRMQHYLQLVQPGTQLELDEQLRPHYVHPAGGTGTAGLASAEPALAGAVARLSYGSQEQLSILSRLAYADLLRQAGQPTLLILDDALVHSDPQRLAHMKRALFDAAQRHQVLLFTCRPQDWGDAGAPLRRW